MEPLHRQGNGNIDPFQAALVHCNAGAVENKNCCKALSAAVYREKFCWSSLFGQIFIADLFQVWCYLKVLRVLDRQWKCLQKRDQPLIFYYA
ncbi:hypothetical protein HAX54_012470 [Datura stramonium]|uniref:Prolamin-like domain-containing protein n=1 Tax=Datura stramonium TaxID=4076 RepID=A0ABS8TLL5_DATST|nr:hypothetical protein [Datura stramonium]